MLASKSSDPTDGFWDLLVIRKTTRLDMMRKFSKLRDGSYVDLKDATNHPSTFFIGIDFCNIFFNPFIARKQRHGNRTLKPYLRVYADIFFTREF